MSESEIVKIRFEVLCENCKLNVQGRCRGIWLEDFHPVVDIETCPLLEEEDEVWKQKRPSWCRHTDCEFIRRIEDAACTGKLTKPMDHGEAKKVNTHHLCINPEGNDGKVTSGEHILCLEIAPHDCDSLRWILDAIDGKKTSWRSK